MTSHSDIRIFRSKPLLRTWPLTRAMERVETEIRYESYQTPRNDLDRTFVRAIMTVDARGEYPSMSRVLKQMDRKSHAEVWKFLRRATLERLGYDVETPGNRFRKKHVVES
jgi:hypothetical protein